MYNKAAALACLFAVMPVHAADFLVYSGSYTSAGSEGIYAFRFQTRSGRLTPLGLAAATSNPSFLVEHPTHRFLYAVNEGGANTVSAFRIDPASAKLTLLNTVSSRGDLPCHLALDRTGRWLAVANYGSATVAVLPIAATGTLGEAVAVEVHKGSGPNVDRQSGPHAHAVVFSADSRWLLLADLGLDKIFVYRFDTLTVRFIRTTRRSLPLLRAPGSAIWRSIPADRGCTPSMSWHPP